MRTPLKREFVRLLLFLLALFIIGYVAGHPLLPVLSGLLVYLLWTFYNIRQLLDTFANPGKQMSESFGVWDEINYQLYNLYKRQNKTKNRLTKFLLRFQESTQALPYATIVLNRNMEIEWFNVAAKLVFNLQKSVDIGQRIDNLVRYPAFMKYLSAMDFSEALELDLNERSIRLTITPYGNHQYLVGAHDITQRRKLETMRRNFTANASHELRTPLTVITGYIEALRSNKNIDESLKKPLQHVHRQAERMESIIDDLMALSRLETSALPELIESINVEQLMQQVFNDMQAFDQGRHLIEINSMPATISGNSEEIRIMMTNLMTNAIRYSAEKTRISLGNEIQGNKVCIFVEDHGVGIAKEHIPHLTERFYRVDPGRSRDQGGTGLGLAIVKHILDRHNATMAIDSNNSDPQNSGSTFRCCFPQQDD
jgi:two-component system phosphate regulon sensor histidine kinase PhoR